MAVIEVNAHEVIGLRDTMYRYYAWRVEIEDARRIYHAIRKRMATGRYHRRYGPSRLKIREYRLGPKCTFSHRVRVISEKAVYIGCQRLTYKQIERFAKAQGWTQ